MQGYGNRLKSDKILPGNVVIGNMTDIIIGDGSFKENIPGGLLVSVVSDVKQITPVPGKMRRGNFVW